MGVRCQKCEIPADSYAMMAGSSICELCEFEEAVHSSRNDADRPCQVCGGETGVRSIQVCGEDLQVCRSCRLNYFAGTGAPTAC